MLSRIDGLYCSYEIAQNINKIKDHVEKYESDKKKLVDKYVEKDEKGIYKQIGDRYDFGSNVRKFEDKAIKMIQQEVEVDFVEISIEDIKDSKGERINPPAIVLASIDGVIIK